MYYIHKTHTYIHTFIYQSFLDYKRKTMSITRE